MGFVDRPSQGATTGSVFACFNCSGHFDGHLLKGLLELRAHERLILKGLEHELSVNEIKIVVNMKRPGDPG
jgi:uncharacterized CHY-type Zn-finger protein